MSTMTQPNAERKWLASGHASLCALGAYLQELDFFAPIAERVHLKQKVYKFSPVQKLEMIFVALLTGATAISHTDTTLRLDPALQQAFGLPGCAEQSVLADTLNAATDQDVTALREAVALILQWRGMGWTCGPRAPASNGGWIAAGAARRSWIGC